MTIGHCEPLTAAQYNYCALILVLIDCGFSEISFFFFFILALIISSMLNVSPPDIGGVANSDECRAELEPRIIEEKTFW
jgi:hypothetical protein